MSADKAKTVRKALKDELGLNARQVSVRAARGGALYVTVKVNTPVAPVKAIAERVEHVRRCEYSGDILSGGNTFVFVEVADDVLDEIAAEPTIAKALTAVRNKPGFVIPVEGHDGVELSWDRVSGDFTLWRDDRPTRLWTSGRPELAVARAMMAA